MKYWILINFFLLPVLLLLSCQPDGENCDNALAGTCIETNTVVSVSIYDNGMLITDTVTVYLIEDSLSRTTSKSTSEPLLKTQVKEIRQDSIETGDGQAEFMIETPGKFRVIVYYRGEMVGETDWFDSQGQLVELKVFVDLSSFGLVPGRTGLQKSGGRKTLHQPQI